MLAQATDAQPSDARIREYGPCQRAPSPHCYSVGSAEGETYCFPTDEQCERKRDARVIFNAQEERQGRGGEPLTPCDPMR